MEELDRLQAESIALEKSLLGLCEVFFFLMYSTVMLSPWCYFYFLSSTRVSVLLVFLILVLKLALHKLGVEGLDDMRADALNIRESLGHCLDSSCLFCGLDANVGLWL